MALAASLDARADAEADGARACAAFSAALVFAAIAAGYGPRSSTGYVFVSVIPLFVQQLFATGHHVRKLRLRGAAAAARGGMPAPLCPDALLAGAALAVREAYFYLFVGFDAAWLFHAYARPSPTSSWDTYLQRLAVGPISGMALIVFTVAFWLTYAALFAYGGAVAGNDEDGAAALSTVDRVPFSIGVESGTLRLNGYRMPRPGAQSLILWPGFSQSGFVYDLFPGSASLAEYLHRRGFDVWIFHPRGTGGSDGRRTRASLDDYAACDVPAIISFVAARVSTPPIFVGHSQGGISAILSLMGAELRGDGTIRLSDEAARSRQEQLSGLVTLGSFPSFVFAEESDLQRFVRLGIPIRFFGRTFRISLRPLLSIARAVPFLGVPISAPFRRALAASVALRVLTLPIFAVLEMAGRLRAWEFLYHIPNVSTAARRKLFFSTIEGTFTGILEQYYDAVYHGAMRSRDGRVNYSDHYASLRLPVSFVAMELDGFVDETSMVKLMVDRVASQVKFVTHVPGLGHEDFFMNPRFFSQALAGIENLCADQLPVPPMGEK